MGYDSHEALLPGESPEPVLVRKPYIYFHAANTPVVLNISITFPKGQPLTTIPEAKKNGSLITWEKVKVTPQDSDIEYQGEKFPYLFYEGKTNYCNPLKVEIIVDDQTVTFKVKNLADITIKHIFLICKPTNYLSSGFAYTWLKELEPNRQKK